MLKQWLAAAAASLVFAGTAGAGVVVEWQDGETAFLAGEKFKSAAGDGTWIVFDTGKQTMTSVDDRLQSYSVATVAEFCAAVRALYEEQLAQIPEELRALVEEQMKALQGETAAPVRFEIRKAGSGGEIAGYATTRYEVFRDGEKTKEFFLAEKTAANAEAEVGKFWDMAFRLSECSVPGNERPILVVEQDPEYRRLVADGWVMKEVDLSAGEPEVEAVVESMSKEPIDEAEFVPPAAYQKLSAIEFLRQEMMAGEEELAPAQ